MKHILKNIFLFLFTFISSGIYAEQASQLFVINECAQAALKNNKKVSPSEQFFFMHVLGQSQIYYLRQAGIEDYIKQNASAALTEKYGVNISPDSIGVFLVWENGSALCTETTTNIPSWNPAVADEMYDRFLVRRVAEMALHPNFIDLGIIYIQGTGDCISIVCADKYYENFLALQQRFRADLNNPNLPILTHLISPQIGVCNKHFLFAGADIVSSTQKQIVDEYTYTYLIPHGEKCHHIDFGHYDALSINAIILPGVADHVLVCVDLL